MTGAFFVPDGYAWSAVPPLALLPWGRGRHLFEFVVEKKVRGDGSCVKFFNRDVAHEMGVSPRYVQLALAELERLGFIVRQAIKTVEATGRIVWRRVVTMLMRPAASKRKLKAAAALASKNFGPGGAKSCAGGAHAFAGSSLRSESQTENQQAGVVGVGPDGPPPPPSGSGDDAPADPPAPVEDPAAVLRAAIAAAKAAEPAPEPPAAVAPAVGSSSPPDGSLAARVRGLAADLEAQTERRAAEGDPAALLEMAARRKAAPAEPSPAPIVESPEVDSTQQPVTTDPDPPLGSVFSKWWRRWAGKENRP